MQLVQILSRSSIEITLTDKDGELGFQHPPVSDTLGQEAIDQAVEEVQLHIANVASAELPFKLPDADVFFAYNIDTPFLATELLTVSYLFHGMTFSVDGTQYFIPNKVLDNPTEYFEKLEGMNAFVLQGTNDIYPDVAVLWKTLGDKHPLTFIDTVMPLESKDFKYEKLNTIEVDQFEVHVSKFQLDGNEDADVLIAVDKMDPDISYMMYVNLANIYIHGDFDSLGRTAVWTKYLSPRVLVSQDIFGRALRELDFLRQ